MITCKHLAVILPIFWVLPAPAMAVLGGDESSVTTDQVKMKATRRIVNSSQYTTHEIQEASGTLVKEYVSTQGQVFAVTWKGPYLPDLQQILGEHFTVYGNAANNKRSRRGSVQVQQSDLVIQSGGHMRAFIGRAYIPRLLPANVTADDIR